MNKAESILRQHNLKVTTFRSEVMEIFLTSQHALLLGDIESRLDTHDRITLYRTLKNFEDKGLVHKVNVGTTSTKYALCVDDCSEDAHADEHVHFHCNRCDNTFCLDHVHIPTIQLPSGFAFANALMTINGVCKECSVI